jgi:hypothetical protein
MGRLVVEARGTAATGAGQGFAAAGNRDPMPIIVSVTDADGAPVSGLDATDFTIEAEWVAQGGGGQVQIPVTAIGDHGNYRLGVVLGDDDQGNPTKWAPGRYIFRLAFTSGADQGQTLCDVLVQ